MLGQPVSMLIPRVVGFKLHGSLPDGRHRDRPRAHHHPDAAQARRGRQVRRVLRRRRGRRAAGQPGHHRQHEPRVRLHLRHLPDRRRDHPLPEADRPPGRAGRARRGVRQGAGPVARPGAPNRPIRSTSSWICPLWCRRSPARSGRRTGSRCPTRRPRSAPCCPTTCADDGVDEESRGELPGLRPAGVQLAGRRRPGRTSRRPCTMRRRHLVRARPRRGRDRVDHLLHQHLQPAGDDRRGAAGPQGGRARAGRQAVGEDHARARVQSGHGLLREGRPRAVPGEARLPPGRLRLHHLHRQLRPAARRGLGRGATQSDLAVVSVLSRQPQLRGPDQPRREDELPGLAAAGGGLRDRRHDGHRPGHASRSASTRRATRSTWPTSGPRRRRCRTVIDVGDLVGDVHQGLRRRVRRRRALALAAHPDRARRSPGTPTSTYVRKPPYFEGMAGPAGAGHRHRRRPGAGQAGRLGHHRPHLAGRLHQGRLPGRPVPHRARRRPQGLQLVRLAARQPRGDDPGHVRQHPAAQPARARRRGRLHRQPPHRRADHDLRRVGGLPGRPACRWSSWPARSTARARRATGRPRAPCCSACGRSSPSRTSASTAPT